MNIIFNLYFMQNIPQENSQDKYPLNSDKPYLSWNKLLQLIFGNKHKVNSIYVNYSTRHLVKNETTRYLDELEKEFAGNNKELAKIRNIVVLDNSHIKIWKFVHKLWIASADEDVKYWIHKNWLVTFFTKNAAIEFTKKQIWYKMYSSRELKTLIKSIPWKSKWKHIEIICNLLKIPITWHINPSWSLSDDTCLLSSTYSFEFWMHYSLAIFEGPKICHLFNWVDIPWNNLFWIWTEQSAYLLILRKDFLQ